MNDKVGHSFCMIRCFQAVCALPSAVWEGMMEDWKVCLPLCSSVAVIGAKDIAGRPVDRVGRYLVQQGFRVYPVHPVRKNVWGLTTYKDLRDIPEPVDIVNVFRASEYCAGHALEALERIPLPKLFWMQLGIFSEEARKLLAGQGIIVVENACLMVEHARLLAR